MMRAKIDTLQIKREDILNDEYVAASSDQAKLMALKKVSAVQKIDADISKLIVREADLVHKARMASLFIK